MEKNQEKINKIQFYFLIFLIILVFVLMFLTIAFFRYGKAITSDPLIYGMKKHNYTYCECLDSKERVWKSSKYGFYSNYDIPYYEYNLSNFSFKG